MGRAQNVLNRMRNNPRDWRIEDIRRVASRCGLSERAPRGGSSHVTFSHPGSARIVTVPIHRPIKPVYVRELVKLIDEVSE